MLKELEISGVGLVKVTNGWLLTVYTSPPMASAQQEIFEDFEKALGRIGELMRPKEPF